MFGWMLDSGYYHKCIDAWAEILYEAIVAAGEAEKERRTGLTIWELFMPGARQSELDDVENQICHSIHRRSSYLEESRVESLISGEIRLSCLLFRSEENLICHMCGGEFHVFRYRAG